LTYITKPNIYKKYPDELTFDEFDAIRWDIEKQFGLEDDSSNNVIEQKAVKFIKLHQHTLVLYTQVDGDSGDRIYAKGHHIVNRTGIWWAVKSQEIENAKS